MYHNNHRQLFVLIFSWCIYYTGFCYMIMMLWTYEVFPTTSFWFDIHLLFWYIHLPSSWTAFQRWETTDVLEEINTKRPSKGAWGIVAKTARHVTVYMHMQASTSMFIHKPIKQQRACIQAHYLLVTQLQVTRQDWEFARRQPTTHAFAFYNISDKLQL